VKDFDEIKIIADLIIPTEELTFIMSRSSKPGGQNVNKLSTRITLQFEIDRSASLSEEQKTRIKIQLRSRISKSGILQISSQDHRSQSANKKTVMQRFEELMRKALTEIPVRKKTKTPYREKMSRLKNKKHRGRLKKLRSEKYNVITDQD